MPKRSSSFDERQRKCHRWYIPFMDLQYSSLYFGAGNGYYTYLPSAMGKLNPLCFFLIPLAPFFPSHKRIAIKTSKTKPNKNVEQRFTIRFNCSAFIDFLNSQNKSSFINNTDRAWNENKTDVSHSMHISSSAFRFFIYKIFAKYSNDGASTSFASIRCPFKADGDWIQ